MLLLALLSHALAQPAPTRQLILEKRGAAPAKVHLDGTYVGTVSKKLPLVLSVSPGTHEVAISFDEWAVWVRCLGTITDGGMVMIKSRGCWGMARHHPRPEGTVVRGGRLDLEGYGLVSLNGGVPWAITRGLWMNLPPDTHQLTVPHRCDGLITVPLDEPVRFKVTDAGCEGYDPPRPVAPIAPELHPQGDNPTL